jgi:hypothetical protein
MLCYVLVPTLKILAAPKTVNSPDPNTGKRVTVVGIREMLDVDCFDSSLDYVYRKVQ